MKSAPRVVLDTNVVLAALLFSQGRLVPIRGAWQRGGVHPLASRATIEELMRALTYPKLKLTLEDQRELVADYLPYCTTVRMPAKLPRTPSCRDPFDAAFLQLALVANADYLVTGDKDLLALQGQIRCPIIIPEAFLDVLATPSPTHRD
jgi:putative PIN family toxin of toxin-antitoxin system